MESHETLNWTWQPLRIVEQDRESEAAKWFQEVPSHFPRDSPRAVEAMTGR